ncbi:MAG: hypothetical protein K2P76_06960 [Lachnospiraceae bacterium]|nr:hypothetical protein [Lachnospiraceae bacterium]MDE6981038.1 hypothetical protein [Lachnospiraceae bacterium]
MRKRKYLSAALLFSMLVSVMPAQLWAGDLPDSSAHGAEEVEQEPGEPVLPGETSLLDCDITVHGGKFIYDGTAKIPEVAVKNGEETLKEDKDYVLVYGNNTNAGIATVTVVGMGDFAGGVKKIFSIDPKPIDDLNINYFTEVKYRGMELRPGVTITYGKRTLKNLTDYVVNYENNRDVGTAALTITGTGNYKGEKKLEFSITPKPISSTLARLETCSFLSDGKEKKPKVIVMNGRERLVENRDYRVTYTDYMKPGVGMVVLEGMGNFNGTLKLKYTLRIGTPVIKNVENTSGGIKVSWKKVSQAESYKLFRRVKDSGKWEIVANLTGTSYTDKKAKTNGRTYQYKVYALTDSVLSNPSGMWTISYLSSPEITSIGIGKPGEIRVKWKRNKYAEGYQIQYATKKDFSNAKIISVPNGKTVKKTISKLNKNKKYYIRIRSYVRSYGEFYSPWSKKKSVKTAG